MFATPRRAVRLCVAVLVTAVFALTACEVPLANEAQVRMVDAVNADRTAYGLPAFDQNGFAYLKAQAWAGQMAARGCDEGCHNPDLFAYFGGPDAGYACAVGENVGTLFVGDGLSVSVDQVIDLVEDAWMNSESHRRNILDQTVGFDAVGTGIHREVEPDGVRWYLVQNFVALCDQGAAP